MYDTYQVEYNIHKDTSKNLGYVQHHLDALKCTQNVNGTHPRKYFVPKLVEVLEKQGFHERFSQIKLVEKIEEKG